MTTQTHKGGRSNVPWRVAGWGGAGLLLLLPLIARAPWTPLDFMVMGGLLGGSGLMLELAMRISGGWAPRAGGAVAVGSGFLLSWVNLGPGFLGLVFIGILAVAAAGAFVARFRPDGMVRAMVATTAAQVALGMVVLTLILGPAGAGDALEAVKVAVGTAFFAALWLLSAWLFHRAGADLSRLP